MFCLNRLALQLRTLYGSLRIASPYSWLLAQLEVQAIVYTFPEEFMFTFLLIRIEYPGISKANVSLATAVMADVTDAATRAKAMVFATIAIAACYSYFIFR